MSEEKRVCIRCKIEKDIKDFYKYTAKGVSSSNYTKKGNYKSICAYCENHNISKYELYKCEICNMDIRKVYKRRHEKSYRHQQCRFWDKQYDSSRLQMQNRRTM
jgi:hypothetical protein